MPCGLSRTGERPLLTGRGAAALKKGHDFDVRDGESPGYFFVGTGEMNAYFYATLGCRFYLHDSVARETFLRERDL